MDRQNILTRVVEWAQKEGAIEAIILQGSHAAGMADAYSDYDLAIFCTSYDSYIKDEKWLTQIGKVWVCVHETVNKDGNIFPTRLVIFEEGVKVDFGFYTMGVLQNLITAHRLPSEYNRGYSVLVDKGSKTLSLAKATHQEDLAKRPTENEFQRVTKEFWFEVHHIAKYLKREDLWSVKFRSGSLNDHFLLKMIEWHEEAKRNWESQVPPIGKRMHSWVDADTWKALHKIFAHFDSRDSRQGLMHTIELFRKIAADTAQRLGYSYPHELDKHITDFTNTILYR